MSENWDTRDFLTKVKDGMNRGIWSINIRSKEAYDTLKVKNRIRVLSKRRSAAALDMGNMIYRTYKYTGKINQDSIEPKCVDIESIEKEIEEWEDKLKLIHLNALKSLGNLKALVKAKVVSICECGAEIYEGTEYCRECLKKVEPMDITK